MMNRRRHDRHPLYYAVQIDTAEKRERVGVARNTSISGVLVGSPSRFQRGQEVELSFRVAPEEDHTRVSGTIVRCDRDPSGGWFSHVYAVQFARELPWLDYALATAEPEQAYLHR